MAVWGRIHSCKLCVFYWVDVEVWEVGWDTLMDERKGGKENTYGVLGKEDLRSDHVAHAVTDKGKRRGQRSLSSPGDVRRDKGPG